MACCGLTAGMRRTLVEVQSQSFTDDGLGGQTDIVWTTVATAYAEVKFKSGKEPFTRGGLYPEAFYQFGFLYADASFITEEHRFLVEDIAYNIRWVDNVELRNRTMYFGADRGVVQ